MAHGLLPWQHVACGVLVAPQPGIKPTSSALEGGFLTTGPSGKFQSMNSCNTYRILSRIPGKGDIVLYTVRIIILKTYLSFKQETPIELNVVYLNGLFKLNFSDFLICTRASKSKVLQHDKLSRNSSY